MLGKITEFRMLKYYNKVYGITTIAINAAGSWKDMYANIYGKLGIDRRLLLQDYRKKLNLKPNKFPFQLEDALSHIKRFDRGEKGALENYYNQLMKEFEDCEKKLNLIQEKMKATDHIAREIFREWKAEIGQLNVKQLKHNSAHMREKDHKKFLEIFQTLTQEADQLKPVMDHLREYLLYFKHQLNAKMTENLYQEMASLKNDLQGLSHNMNQNLKTAKNFTETIKKIAD